MKQLPKEIHVEALDAEHGAEIIDTFKKLGVDTRTYIGGCTRKEDETFRFYGVRDDKFTNRQGSMAGNVVTLEELKSYLEDEIPELPDGVLMYVSYEPIELSKKIGFFVRKRLVLGKRNGKFIAWADADKREDISGRVTSWKYALPIDEPIEEKAVSMTVAEIEKALGITKLNVVK